MVWGAFGLVVVLGLSGCAVVDAMRTGERRATAAGIGRPYIWGLGAFGQEGVEAVLAIMHKEFELTMKQSGVTSLSQISPRHITAA